MIKFVVYKYHYEDGARIILVICGTKYTYDMNIAGER